MWSGMKPILENYRIYRLDDIGRIAPTELIAASDDSDAIGKARTIARNARKCELWHGRRLVVSLNSGELEDSR